MEIRPATSDDLDLLVQLRLAFIADVRATEPGSFPAGFVAATRASSSTPWTAG